MIKVIKILAFGSFHRYMWLEINGTTYCVRIKDDVYCALKSLGVPTSQSMRGKHDSKV